jgi:hypothetical protein
VDTVKGGSNDRIQARDGTADVINCAKGRDKVSFDEGNRHGRKLREEPYLEKAGCE